MGMVHAVQKGDMPAPSKEVAETAKEMKPGDAKDFAETKHKGLPEHVKKEKHEKKDHKKEAFVKGFVQRAVAHGLTQKEAVAILDSI